MNIHKIDKIFENTLFFTIFFLFSMHFNNIINNKYSLILIINIHFYP